MRVNYLEYPLVATVITAATALVVYSLSLAPDLTWAYHGADGAELITAAVTLGVPHPPGYPLYVMLGKLISLVPIGSVAFRFNLLSAVSMAIGAGLISGLVSGVLGERLARQRTAIDGSSAISGAPVLLVALGAGLCFAFLPLVWQQALIAEVYALNTLVVCALLWLIFRQRSPRSALLMGLALGLAVTTHLTSLLLTLPALVALQRRHWKPFALGTFAGLTPFLTLPFLASNNSPVVWGRLDNLANWWWLVSARLYQPNVLSLPVYAWQERIIAWSSEPALWVAAVLLAFIVYRYDSPAPTSDAISKALLATAALYAVYAFGYDADDALVYLLPALAILCLLSGLPLDRATLLYLLLPLALLVLNFQEIDLSNHTEARSLAESPLREAPRDAIIVTTGDHTTFSLWYLQYVEGQRSDVTVVDGNLLAFDWYRARIARANPSLRGLERDDLARFRQLNEPLRPICELRIGAGAIQQYRCGEIAT